MEHREVYRKSPEEADALGEMEKFRESRRLDVRCRDAIEEAIRKNFDGLHLDGACVRQPLDQYGAERVAWVLANTVHWHSRDGRFSKGNREWAEGIAGPGTELWGGFLVESHPAVLNGFIDLYREEMERKQGRREEKPSIRGQLAEKTREGISPGHGDAAKEAGREAR